MFAQKTAFVIGAGASAEFNLPVGAELQQRIAKLLDFKFEDGARMITGDQEIYAALRQRYPSESNQYLQAGRRIRNGVSLANSIDNFIDAHRSDQLVRTMGCLGIVRAIVGAEKASSLHYDPSNSNNDINFSLLQDTWIHKIFRFLQEGRVKEDVESFFENVSFVVFNYDRCVEHFFFRGLINAYGVSDLKSAEIVRGATIVHPYGTIGMLPWQQTSRGPAVGFGATSAPLSLMAEGIRTFTDQEQSRGEIERTQRLFKEAEMICFLGFSYQPQNMAFVTPSGTCAAKSIIGTALDISELGTKTIEKRLRDSLHTNGPLEVALDDLKCGQLIDRHKRTLS